MDLTNPSHAKGLVFQQTAGEERTVGGEVPEIGRSILVAVTWFFSGGVGFGFEIFEYISQY